MINANDFLGIRREPVLIHVAELQADVWIRVLTASEKAKQIHGWVQSNKATADMALARWLVVCFADADGNRIFQDGHERDLVESVPGGVVERYANACWEINGADDVEIDAKKNGSNPIQSG